MKQTSPAGRENRIRRITLWGMVVNLFLTVGKILAGVFGRSAAMVADGVHSLSDFASDIVVIVFVHISSKAKDKEHSYGHGKFETLATLIVSLALVVVATKMMYSGVENIIAILSGEPFATPGVVALAAAAVSIVAKEVLYQVTVKVGKDVGSPVVMANAWHHRSDALSSIGSLIGIGGAILLGDKWVVLDPAVCCIISIMIMVVAVKMAIPSLKELLEVSLPDDMKADIIATMSSVEGVMNVHSLKTRRNGPSVIIDAHVVVSPEISVVEAHDIATAVEEALAGKFGPETQTSIHIEPYDSSK
ncbi:MAG: cation diffusion facilitator family transporter [Candidatus Cryptobacteroides sp.]